MKSKLETKSVHLEECRRQLKENLEQLNIKDIALTEAKRNIEKIKTSHEDEIKVGIIRAAVQENGSLRFPTRSNTNRSIQSRRSLEA